MQGSVAAESQFVHLCKAVGGVMLMQSGGKDDGTIHVREAVAVSSSTAGQGERQGDSKLGSATRGCFVGSCVLQGGQYIHNFIATMNISYMSTYISRRC